MVHVIKSVHHWPYDTEARGAGVSQENVCIPALELVEAKKMLPHEALRTGSGRDSSLTFDPLEAPLADNEIILRTHRK